MGDKHWLIVEEAAAKYVECTSSKDNRHARPADSDCRVSVYGGVRTSRCAYLVKSSADKVRVVWIPAAFQSRSPQGQCYAGSRRMER